MEVVIGIDPGREKCGFAVLALSGQRVFKAVVDTAELTAAVRRVLAEHHICKIIMGNGTSSRQARQTLTASLPELAIVVVDEYRTTDLARARYFAENPPTGLKRLLPRGLLYPPVPVDDYAAVILAERYLTAN